MRWMCELHSEGNMDETMGSTATCYVNVIKNLSILQDALTEKFQHKAIAKSDASTLIETLITTIQDLNAERLQLHHLLETETIKSSSLRMQVNEFPRRINDELDEVIKNAEEINACTLQEMQSEVDAIGENIKYLEGKLKMLKDENAELQPKSEQLKQQHQEVMNSYNNSMAEKTSKQIGCNETWEQIKDTNKKIADLEEAIIILQEDLVDEQEEAVREQQRILDMVADTTVNVSEQKDVNVAKKSELDKLLADLSCNTSKLYSIKKSIQSHHTTLKRLGKREQKLAEQLETGQGQIKRFEDEGTKIRSRTAELHAEFEKKMTDCKSQLVELNDRIDTETENDKKLSKYRRKVEKELNEITKLKAQSTARLQELKKSHQKIKKDISAKAQECGRYSMENSTMEISMDQVQETHQIETTQLNMNFDVQKQNQEKDIKLRAKLQQDRNQLLRDTDQFKQEHQRFMTNTNNRLDEAKRCESDLIAQAAGLSKAISAADTTIAELTEALTTAEQEFESMKSFKLEQIDKLKESIAISKNTAESKRELLVKMQTEVSDLEITFNNMSAEYNAVKKKLTDLRSKKISLEVKIKKATKTIEDMNQTKEENIARLDVVRSEYVQLVRQAGKEMLAIEQAIRQLACKLKIITEENSKLEKKMGDLKKECSELTQCSTFNENMKIRLSDSVTLLSEALTEKWAEGDIILQECGVRDETLISQLGDVLSDVKIRESQLSSVTNKMQEKISEFASFIEQVDMRRPLPDELTMEDTGTQSSSKKCKSSKAKSMKPLKHKCKLRGKITKN